MIYGVTNKIYKDFVNSYSLQERKGQPKTISYFMLPYYGKTTTVLAEGQTGTGKTLSYLFPLLLQKLMTTDSELRKSLKKIPEVVAKGTEDYFLSDRTKEEIIDSIMTSTSNVSDELFKEATFSPAKKTFIVTATKMLQQQVINEINRINDYLIKHGSPEITYSVFTGRTNYLCEDHIQKARESLLKKKEEFEKKITTATSDVERDFASSVLQETRDAIRYLNDFLASGFSSLEQVKEKYGNKWEEVMETIENTDTDIYAPPININNNNIEGTCFKCEKESCPRKTALKEVRDSDVVIMNYYSMLSFFSIASKYYHKLEQLRSSEDYLNSLKKEWLDKGLDVDKPPEKKEMLQKYSQEEITEFMDFKKKWEKYKDEKAKLTELSTFENKLSEFQFIFDEAHSFGEALSTYLATELNLKDLRKKTDSLFRKIEKLYIVSTQTNLYNSTPSNQESLKRLYEKLMDFNQRMKKAMDEIVNEYKELKDKNQHSYISAFHIQNLASKYMNSSEDDSEKELLCMIDFYRHLTSLSLSMAETYVASRDRISEYPVSQQIKVINMIHHLAVATLFEIRRKMDNSHGVITEKFKEDIKNQLPELKNIECSDVIMKGWDITIHKGGNYGKYLNYLFNENWNNLRRIFTSATLTTEGDFSYIKKLLGLNPEKSIEFIVSTPYNIEENSRLYLPSGIPRVMFTGTLNPAWKEYVEKNLEKYLFSIKGGVLILTTSGQMHDMFVDAIKANKEEWEKKYGQEIKLFTNYDTKDKVLKNFGIGDIEKEKHVLVSKKTYSHGFDAKGERLTTVIIAKMPFDPPGNQAHVNIEGRKLAKHYMNIIKKKNPKLSEEEVRDAAGNMASWKVFEKLIVNKTFQDMRQMFGRLIRDPDDKGVIILLDNRIKDDPVISRYFLKAFSELPYPIIREEKEFQEFASRVNACLSGSQMWKQKKEKDDAETCKKVS